MIEEPLAPGRLETVRVKRDGGRGWHTINRSDYDPTQHTLFDDAPGTPVAPKSKSPRKGKE